MGLAHMVHGSIHRLPHGVSLKQRFHIRGHCAKIVVAPFISEDDSWNTALADRSAP